MPSTFRLKNQPGLPDGEMSDEELHTLKRNNPDLYDEYQVLKKEWLKDHPPEPETAPEESSSSKEEAPAKPKTAGK